VRAHPGAVAIFFGLLAAMFVGVWLMGSIMRPAIIKAQAKADVAVDHADAATLKDAGAVQQAVKVDTFNRQAVAVHDATATLSKHAGAAPDANSPLDPARATRLLDHDRQLCLMDPAACGDPGTGDPG
jgi:zona occludens toxin (predicted ATPase)